MTDDFKDIDLLIYIDTNITKEGGREMPFKISIIGAGFVGATCASVILSSGLASEVVMVDINRKKAEGEALDLAQGAPFVKPVDVYAGDIEDCKDSAIIIFTAGANQQPGETRLDLASKNARIVREMVPKLIKAAPEAILLIVSNPVDVLTYEAIKASKLPPERVIGSGTVLDTSRFRYALSQHIDLDARNIHAYIVGEHGDSEVALWSLTNVAGISLDEFCKRNDIALPNKQEIFDATRNAAYKIIEGKGATYYAVSYAVKRICEVILRDERSVLTVSGLINGIYGIQDTCLSLPTIISRKGREKVLSLPLSREEEQALVGSAKIIKEYQDKVTLD